MGAEPVEGAGWSEDQSLKPEGDHIACPPRGEDTVQQVARGKEYESVPEGGYDDWGVREGVELELTPVGGSPLWVEVEQTGEHTLRDPLVRIPVQGEAAPLTSIPLHLWS